MLFSGSQGLGKTFMSQKVAKALGMAPGTLSTALNVERCEAILDKAIDYISKQGGDK